MQVITVEKIPRALIQGWINDKVKNGYHQLMADRVSIKTGQTVKTTQIVSALKFLAKKPDPFTDIVIIEMLQFLKEQGHELPDYVYKYLDEHK